MARKLAAILLSAIIAVILFPVLSLSAGSPPAAKPNLPAAPGGLKNYFMLGLANQPNNLNWMTGSGASWDARYQYLTGGANTNAGWSTWNTPAGQFATYYMDASSSAGYIPIFTYYQMLGSAPATGTNESDKDYNNLNNPTTMNAYFADFKLLMDKIKAFGKTVIVHIEPDLWGFMQKRSADPNGLTAAVKSSAYADVATFPDTLPGFAKALISLRDKYAPNALMAYHISPWASTIGDVSTSTNAGFDVNQAAQQTANFYLSLGANFDLMFYDISDRDAARYATDPAYNNPNHWWDMTNNTFPNFNRSHQFAAAITSLTSKRGMYWQVPLGNTIYCSMNNTSYHWQDNKLQYYLNSGGTSAIQDLANAGIIGILFGSGDATSTTYYDAAGDGVTNPASFAGCKQTTLPDDDGGYLRQQAAAYYQRGPVTLPSGGASSGPVYSASITTGPALALVNQVGSSDNLTFQITNTGTPGANLIVNPGVLTGPNPGQFNISPSGQINLAQGASQNVSVQCTPQAATTYNANLTFTTNDPNRGTITYTLTCTGVLPKFSSSVAPAGTIKLFNKVGSSDSMMLTISNIGHPRTNLTVSAPIVGGANPGAFSITPATSFNLSGGSPAQKLTIQCTPAAATTYTATLSFNTSAPAPYNVATYNLSCRGLNPVTVSDTTNFTSALNNFSDGQIIIFANSNIQVNAALPALKSGTIIDGGSCPGGNPATTITGPGAAQSIPGLVLQGGSIVLRNIKITNFAKQQIVIPAGSRDNQFNQCVEVKR